MPRVLCLILSVLFMSCGRDPIHQSDLVYEVEKRAVRMPAETVAPSGPIAKMVRQ
jgi:hypothetical protein